MSCRKMGLVGLAASIAAAFAGLASAASDGAGDFRFDVEPARQLRGPGQDAESITVDALPPAVRDLVLSIMTQPRASPGVSFGSPIGFGAQWGDFFFGVNGATTSGDRVSKRRSDFFGGLHIDGSTAIGAGIGNPTSAVGLEMVLNVISLTDDFGDSGAVALKLHRSIGARGALAIGTENDVSWGEARRYVRKYAGTRFVSYSQYFQLRRNPVNPGALMATVGVGEGRLGKVHHPDQALPFASIGYAWTRQFSTIVDYSGEATNFALSIVPLRKVPVSAVVGWSDAFERRADSTISFGIGYSTRF